MSQFVWTEHGHRIHVSDDGLWTRCGWPVTSQSTADDVVYYWPPCSKCVRS